MTKKVKKKSGKPWKHAKETPEQPVDEPYPTTYARRTSDNFEVVVNVDSLRKDGRSVTGYLAVRLTSWVFPSVFWVDFIVSLMGQWIDGAASLLGKSRAAIWSFNDGPYEMHVDKPSPGSREWIFQGFDRGDTRTFPSTEKVSIDSALVVRELIVRGREVVAACRAKGWDSKVVGLESAIFSLERTSQAK